MATTIDLSRRQMILATIGVMCALLLASLDGTIVGNAMPRIVAELQGLDYYAWVTTAYLVTSTVLVPVAGKLGDMFGRKPFLLAGMIGFVGASALCGLSQNMVELVVFRGIQGLAGGVLFASVFAVLADIFPPTRRARMQGLFGGVFGLSSVIGPTIGGWLTDGPGWRWCFYVNVPVGVLAVAMVLIALPYVRSKAQLRDIDWAGAVTLAGGVVPLLVALSITRDHAWDSPQVLALLGAAAAFLLVFVLVETRTDQPIIPFGLFRNNVFAICVVVSFLSALGMFGTILFVPLLYQGVLGVSATNSGQLLIPMFIGLITFSTLSGQLMTRVTRYRFLGTAGCLIMIGGLFLLSQVSVSTHSWQVAIDIAVVGAGLGMTFPLTFTAVQSALPRALVGVGSSQVMFWRNLGGTIGSAVLGSVLARQLPQSLTDQVAKLNFPPGSKLPASGGSTSPQALLDPTALAHMRASVPAQVLPLVDQFIGAARVALANTLHDLFLISTAVVVLALVATLFMREVPLLSARAPAFGGEAPSEVEIETEPAEATA